MGTIGLAARPASMVWKIRQPLQRNSRVGVTASVPLTKHQSLKLSYNNGAYIRYGGNYQNISFGWQYSWLGRPN